MARARRDYTAELNVALVASAVNGWTYIGNNTMRRMTEHSTPQFAKDNGWWTSATYSTCEFLSFIPLEDNRAPKAVYGTAPCTWVRRTDSKVSFKRALELLAQPLADAEIHDRD